MTNDPFPSTIYVLTGIAPLFIYEEDEINILVSRIFRALKILPHSQINYCLTPLTPLRDTLAQSGGSSVTPRQSKHYFGWTQSYSE